MIYGDVIGFVKFNDVEYVGYVIIGGRNFSCKFFVVVGFFGSF